MKKHEHVWHGVGLQPVVLVRKDMPTGVIPMDITLTTIVRACDCGDYYLQPIDDTGVMDLIRPWPEWAKR